MTLLRLLGRETSQLTPRAVWGLGAAALLLALLTALPLTRSLSDASIASSYLEVAVNRAWCGRYPYMTGAITTDGGPVNFASIRPGELPDQRIRAVAEGPLGSIDQYCATTGSYGVVNEITFAVMESALLWLDPQITFQELAHRLAWLRVGLIGLFGVLLIRLHYSPLLVFSAVAAALHLTVLLGNSALYSQYPFLLPGVLAGIAAAGLSLSFRLHHHRAPFMIAALGLGLWTAALGNLRTSYYPAAIFVGAVFLVIAARDRSRSLAPHRRWVWPTAAALCWVGGVVVFDAAYVRPLRAAHSGYNSSAHVIAHPLVLGLANPGNELARREGIIWSDPRGVELARRIDPKVEYLGPGYERALAWYYLRLWKRHPGEMAHLYLTKATMTSRLVLEFAASELPDRFWADKDGTWLGIAVWPLALFSFVPVPVFLVAVAIAAWRLAAREPARALLLASIGVIGLMAFAESTVVLGNVFLWYSSVFVFCTVFTGLLVYQTALDVLAPRLARTVRALRQSPQPEAARPGPAAHEGRATRSVAVIAPFFNEADGLARFHEELTRALRGLDYTAVFVDDGSSDDTLARLNQIAAGDPRVQVFALSRNFGHQIALTAGLDVADADAVVLLDSDLQHPPALIPEMISLWRDGGFDVVCAVRRSTADASRFKRWSASAFYWLINRLSDTPITPGGADFCLLSRRAHQALAAMPERHRFLRGMVAWIGFSRTTIEFDAPARIDGPPKYTVLKSARLAWDAILSFSSTPMRLAVRAGAAVAAFGAVYLAYVLGRYFLLGDLERGWGSLMAVLLVMGGANLMFIGLMGEYVVRVFEETKHRPLYFFKQDPRGGTRPHGREAAPAVAPADV